MTLLELVFVIVLIAILAKTGSEMLKVRHLRDDAAYVAMKIDEARFAGIGFDHRGFDGGETGGDEGCVTLSAEGLEENATAGRAAYRLHVTLSGDLAGKTLCFDRLGRPHDDGSHVSEPLGETKSLILQEGADQREIKVLPQSGYVIIR
jgi:hypothetical protein